MISYVNVDFSASQLLKKLLDWPMETLECLISSRRFHYSDIWMLESGGGKWLTS
ncbi:hypothetical protein S1OALGB6SA_613 [Olavius algarvensis spirochete endosymbiont]|uniref:hypothetical protein n=1 Tax=Olavius algarvensis spirochete endosymbiont TaxID=260710 RepID=UPI000AD166C0|nr:hypothetical protein [Olavius algarvensis spirochete endosymbiont]CAD7840964.1 MAG: hypothetical protein [Olavius algarvensis spirochete endosymbiont]VDA99544.1 hypothetical protein S1OALGB6SA_613 [Olavius algarvensis spirochete endosymbiont]